MAIFKWAVKTEQSWVSAFGNVYLTDASDCIEIPEEKTAEIEQAAACGLFERLGGSAGLKDSSVD